MSKWDEVHTEPLHDHPAEKDQLVAAMEAAGYVLDTLERTEDNLRFYGAYGNVMIMGGWHECEEWLNGVVFDVIRSVSRKGIRREPHSALWRIQRNRTTITLTASLIISPSRIRRKLCDSRPRNLKQPRKDVLFWKLSKPGRLKLPKPPRRRKQKPENTVNICNTGRVFSNQTSLPVLYCLYFNKLVLVV